MRRLVAGLCVGVLLGVFVPGVVRADEVRGGQWYLDALGVAAAREITRGAGVRIGMVDSGVDAEHPDLVGNVEAGRSSWSGGEDGLVDPHLHGTQMAGLMVGHGHGPDGGDGVLGVAPEASVVSVSIFPPDHDQEDLAPDTSTEEALVQGIQWLADQDVDVMLLALSGDGSQEQREAVEYAAEEKGIVIITGTGNIGDDEFAFNHIQDPARYQQTTAVAGTTRDGEHWERSRTGAQTLLAAPALDVLSTVPGGGYEVSHGTSNSAALVAGVAALMKSQWPDMPWEVVQWRITETAKDMGAEGWDEETGFGLVDPVAALTEHVEPPEHRTDEEVNPEPYPREEPVEEDTASGDAAPVLAGDGGGSVWWLVGGAAAVLAILAGAILWIRGTRRATVVRE